MSPLHSCPRLVAEQSAKVGAIVGGYARGLSPQLACLADDAIGDAWVRELERETVPVFEPEGETTARVIGHAKYLLRRWEIQGGQRDARGGALLYLDNVAMAQLILEEYEMSAALDDYDVANLVAFIEGVLRPEQLASLRIVRGELPWPRWPLVTAQSARRLRRQELRDGVTELVRSIVNDLLGPEGGKPEPKRPRVVHDPAPYLRRWQAAGEMARPSMQVDNRTTTGSALNPATGLGWTATPLAVTEGLRAASFASLSCAAQRAAVAARPDLARFL